jgi:hypothetical protein
LQIVKATLSKKSKTGGITKSCRARAIKTAWHWHKNRYEGQWNKLEDPDMNPCRYAHLIFDKGTKNIQWRKDSLFNKSCWENWIRRLKLDTIPISKWIKELKIRPERLKLVQERAGEHTAKNKHRQ